MRSWYFNKHGYIFASLTDINTIKYDSANVTLIMHKNTTDRKVIQVLFSTIRIKWPKFSSVPAECYVENLQSTIAYHYKNARPLTLKH